MTAACLFLVSAPAPAATTKTLVIRLKSITVSSSGVDKAPKGLSRGDVIHARFRLLNAAPQFGRKVGAAVGKERSTYTFLSASRATVSGTVTLPGGTIRYKGHGVIGSNAPVPVVGGTGRYAAARGRLVVGEGKSPLNTYYLTVP
jgi:allene oxide cyclase-like protein